MLKRFTLFLIALILFEVSMAQSFVQGNRYLSLGYGQQAWSVKKEYSIYQGREGFDISGFGPITLKGEYAVTNHIGIGFSTVYSNSRINWLENPGTEIHYYQVSDRKFTFTPRLNLHFSKSNVFDFYMGGGFGFRNRKREKTTNDIMYQFDSSPISIPISMELSMGCRFNFADNVGSFLEFGVGHGYLQGGVFVRL